MQESFYTIKESVIGELTEKKSRFIAKIFYVQNEDEASKKIEEVKKDNRDARHNVYAYRLENGFEKYSDDGEPSGTAGVPILDILRGEKLVNVLIVVTRYFGGILLGTGGLVRAYSGAAKLALENTNRVEMRLCIEYKIIMDYDSYNSLQHYFLNNNIKIISTNFLEKIEVNVLVIESFNKNFLYDLNEITGRKAYCERIDQYYHE